MSSYQILTVAICVTINMIDGFDVLAVAFTAPAIAKDWAVPPDTLGILLSSGLAGMMMGSLFLAPFGDHIGRRRLIIVSLVLITAGMLASAFAYSVGSLTVMRWVTGLGVGGALASLNTLTAEYSSSKRRDIAIAFLQTGYPIGATVGGTISAYLLLKFGWRSVFIFGGLCSAAAIPLVVRRLPESIDFLITSRKPDALARINAILARMEWTNLDEIPTPAGSKPAGRTVRQILASEFRRSTLLIWSAFFMVFFAFYFAISWTPTLLVDAGLSVTLGISGAVLMNVGGIIGAIIWGALAPGNRLRSFLPVYFLACALSFLAFGLTTTLWSMLAAAFMIGFFIFPCVVGLYTIAPRLYPTEIRTTGVGWAIGIGRFGAIFGPYVAGLLLADGWEMGTLYFSYTMPLLLAALLVALITIPKQFLG